MTPSLNSNGKDAKLMTDAELIEAVATEVMGWKKWYWDEPAHGRAWGWVHAGHYASHRDRKKCEAYWQWNPARDYDYLGVTVKADWNHTMEVVNKIDEHGLYWNAGNNVGDAPYCCIWPGKLPKAERTDEFGNDIQWSVSGQKLQRAICIAAVQAVRSTK